MTKYISFLRGINVGGSKKIKMDELKHVYEGLGCSDVTTFMQTGNVLFKASKIPYFDDAIEEYFGYRMEVIVRKMTELEKILNSKAFIKYEHLPPKWQVVMFLTKKPSAILVSSIKTNNEEIWLQGKELFINFPQGIGRSRLTINKIESSLGGVGYYA